MVWAKRVSWVVMALALTSGCTKAGRSLVQANVDADATVNGSLARVEIVVKDQSSASLLKRQSFPWTATNSFGVFLDSGVHGKVLVSAEGFDASSPTAIAVSNTQVVDVVAGQVSGAVSLHLLPGTPPNPDGGAGGAGGAAAGTGGAGVGGAGTGTGGSAGTTGATGGVAPQGGAGGGAAGGAGGKPGRSWQGAMLAEKNVLMSDYYPAMAVDAKGNIVVVYTHGAALWSNYFSATTGTWGTEGPVEATTGGNVGGIHVAVDKDGKWLAVWVHQQDDPTPDGIWQSTSTDGVHWSAPAVIASGPTLFSPAFAMNANGVAAVTWTENIQPNNRYTPEASVRVNGTWTAPRILMTGNDTSYKNSTVAVTAAGDAVVVWEATPDGASYSSILQSTFAGGAWTASPVRVDSGVKEAFSAAIAANRAGQYVVTWIESTSAVAELWARRYPATGTPEAATKITEGFNITYDPPPAVTLDESGTATVAWAFEVKTKYNAYTSRAPWGQAWSPALAMETDDAATNDKKNEGEWIIEPAVGHDDAGNVVLAWKKRTGTRFDMYACTFDAAGAKWGPATLLETHDSDGTHETSTYSPALSVGASGVAVVAWYYGYEADIWANIYR